ncbi:OB-fold nucleic acid binding domain-containing protein [Myceligenerans salitolerans]|uniref:OB-fold nucleic acid binding domain-containing protein n=1 Tax=Myceligenerans salitolerans TaxID=1230528 RepID=A0ABS3IF67_9MICO|nr:OB-fold nucleic acid binding domain-containing protein [Myceligenerans salitolerans]MBO0610667.1 OB-fold nucleic acid binding domain-containing protein [Myceligenerans salitolerans]
MGLRSALAGVLASNDEREAVNERAAAARSAGCTAVDRLETRRRGSAAGILRSVVLRPREGVPTVEAELYDGSGVLDLVWLGRRSIAGIEPGRRLRVEGMVSDVHGRRTIFNPRYELRPRPAD